MSGANVYSSSQYVMLDCAENGDVIVKTPYNEDWIKRIRSVPSRKWNTTDKCWVIPGTKSAILLLCNVLREVPVELKNTQLGEQFPELLQLQTCDEKVALQRLSESL